MVLILLTMVFVLMRVAPGDPVQSAVGGRLPPNQIAEIRENAGLDEPLVTQYFDYIGDVLTLDFGETITDNRQVTDVIVESGGATLTLSLAALLVAVGLGLPLGLLAGRYRDTALDASLRVFGILTYAAPVFFVGLLAQLLFGSILGWLPTSGEADPVTFVPEVTHILIIDTLIAGDFEAFQDVLLHLILPSVTLGLLLVGVFLRLTRVNVMQALNGDYIEAARARGIGERSVVVRHAFRNALVPVITVMGLQVALLLSGATLTEVTFDWPGLGSELYAYLNERDYIAVQGLITVFALVVVVASIVIDLVTAMIDPRVRY
jgi:peptide/nickel transport system permease protein